jgi:hypothetical protein
MTAPLAAALRTAASGSLTSEAGTSLLISCGAFLHRPDFTRYLTRAPAGTGCTPLAWIGWDAAITALSHGQLPASSGEKAILRLAASLAAGTPVSLRDTIPSLDHRNLELAATAIRHATGYPR